MENLQGQYLHHKGKYYDVLGEAHDISSQIVYIIYKQNYGRKCWWIRPKEMFFEKIVYNGENVCHFEKKAEKINIGKITDRTFSVRHTETGEKYLARYKKYCDRYVLLLKNFRGEQMELEIVSAEGACYEQA